MVRVARLVIVILSVASLAWGLEIVGPDSTPVYRRAAWKAKAAASQTVSWGINPRGVAEVQQVGDEILVWAPPGRYELELLAIGPSQDPVKPFTLERVYRQVTIGPAGPDNPPVVPPDVPLVPPGPVPVPPPKPDQPPTFPAGKFGLAAKSWAWASLLAPDARVRAATVAASYRNVIAEIKKANAGDPLHNVPAMTIPRNEILATTTGGRDKEGNTWGNIAAINGTDWTPFFKALGGELAKLNIESNADFAIAWDEIAVGLEAVKQ